MSARPNTRAPLAHKVYVRSRFYRPLRYCYPRCACGLYRGSLNVRPM